MIRIKALSTDRPLLFVLLTVLGWMVVAGVGAAFSAWYLDKPIGDDVPQSLGTIAASVLLLLLTWRLGWHKDSGIAGLGSRRTWALSVLVLAYLVAVYSYSFFGELAFDFGIFYRSSAARTVFVRQIVVGTTEELLFRGLIMYALVRSWGRTRTGILTALGVQAAIFAFPHLLYVFFGNSVAITLANLMECFVSGLLMGTWALLWRTIWPGVVFHAMTNTVAMAGVLNVLGPYQSEVSYYLLVVLLQLPLLAVILGSVLHKAPTSKRPFVLLSTRST